MKNFSLIVFNEEQKDELLHVIPIKAKGNSLVDRKGHPVDCEACGTHLTKENLGAVMHGSTLLYCENTACMLEYMERHGNGKTRRVAVEQK